MSMQIVRVKKGKEKTLNAKASTTLDDLMEWQETRIKWPGYESISIVIDGAIHSTLEA